MTERIKELNEALPGILILDFAYLLIGELIIFLVFEEPAKIAVGFFAGIVYAVFCVFNMSFRVRKVVYGRADSRRTFILGYLIRLLVMILVFAVLYYSDVGNILAALAGMFAMKISAYLQPVTQKISSKISGKGGEKGGEHECDLNDVDDSL